jgi:hypothetical protein
MNEGMMTLGEALNTLKELFPNLEDEIILSALIQNENNYEATLDALLFFTSNEKKEKELSLFDYDKNNAHMQSQYPQEKEKSYKETTSRKESNQSSKNRTCLKNQEEVVEINEQVEQVEKKSFGQKFKCI